MKKVKQPSPQRKAYKASKTMVKTGRGEIISDVLGSYTGSPAKGERPEQDADDI